METVQDFLNLANKYSEKENEQRKLVEELKLSYRREKTALEAKLNSITNYNNVNKKNCKVENKMISYDTVTQSKLDYIDLQIQNNEEKRFREIAAVNTKCDNYKDYLLSQKRGLENKKDIVIKDLSSNIINVTLCDEIDEAAYPKLTKMKITIEEEEKKVEEYFNTKMDYIKKADEASIKRDKREEREREQRRKADEAEQNEKERVAFEKKRQENAIIQEQNYQKSLQNMKKAEEEEEQKANKEKVKLWKKNRYLTMSQEYKDYYEKIGFEKISEFQNNLSSNEEIIEYIDSIKEQLDNYITFCNYLNDKDQKMDDKYNYLSYKQRFEIAQIPTKIKKIEKIKELYAIKIEEEKEYPITIELS